MISEYQARCQARVDAALDAGGALDGVHAAALVLVGERIDVIGVVATGVDGAGVDAHGQAVGVDVLLAE